jgi:hypothetical protein
MDEMLEQAERQREQQEALRLEKLPRTLHRTDDMALHQVWYYLFFWTVKLANFSYTTCGISWTKIFTLQYVILNSTITQLKLCHSYWWKGWSFLLFTITSSQLWGTAITLSGGPADIGLCRRVMNVSTSIRSTSGKVHGALPPPHPPLSNISLWYTPFVFITA